MIRAAFPEHGILAEEGAEVKNGSGYLWVIDPLDGTTNYAHGYPQFAVSLGLEYAGRILLGVVYDSPADAQPAPKNEGGCLKCHRHDDHVHNNCHCPMLNL